MTLSIQGPRLRRWSWRAGALVAVLALAAGPASAEQVVWRFDSLSSIGGHAVQAEGGPKIISSPAGRAVLFDGVDDSLLIDGRPLVGAQAFTIEVLIRPDGGKFEQRFMHIAETDPQTGSDAQGGSRGDPNSRIMFEVRVEEGLWWLDAFLKSKAGGKALILKDKVHPVGRWHAVAQTYDGQTYRTYVDGVLEVSAEVPFTPHGPGRVRVGARMNRVDHFKGAIASARFTDRALASEELLKAPR